MSRADPAATDLAAIRRQLSAWRHLIKKLNDIRALHIGGYNTPVPVEKTAVEFFYAVGDVLEGVPLEQLDLKVINKEEVLREAEDNSSS